MVRRKGLIRKRLTSDFPTWTVGHNYCPLRGRSGPPGLATQRPVQNRTLALALVSREGFEPSTYGLSEGGRDRTRTSTGRAVLCLLSYTLKSVRRYRLSYRLGDIRRRGRISFPRTYYYRMLYVRQDRRSRPSSRRHAAAAGPYSRAASRCGGGCVSSRNPSRPAGGRNGAGTDSFAGPLVIRMLGKSGSAVYLVAVRPRSGCLGAGPTQATPPTLRRSRACPSVPRISPS